MGERNNRDADFLEGRVPLTLIDSFTVPRPETCDECDFGSLCEEGYTCCGATREEQIQGPADAARLHYYPCRFVAR